MIKQIEVSQLRLLPFCELRNLQKYIQLINPIFMVDDQYSLYLYLLKYPCKLTQQQLEDIASINQPKQIIQLIISQKIIQYHIDNLDLPNTFAVLKLIKEPISQQIIKTIIQKYFWYRHELQTVNRTINKEILALIKFWIDKSCITSQLVLQIFQKLYLDRRTLNIENEFKLLELILGLQQYKNIALLSKCPTFQKHLINGFLTFNSGYCNIIVPNMYIQMASIYNDYSKEVEVFLDIFSTLNSFGVHLIKDIWEQFYVLCNSKIQFNYISIDTLMIILLKKVANHNNENIPKHCIRQFLKSQKIDLLTLFSFHSTVVYDGLVPILNSGQFYLDCPLQKDSKFFKYVSKFFSKAYNQMEPQRLKNHLKLFIQSVSKYITYDQALPAFMMVFKHISTPVSFFGSAEVNIVSQFLQKVYKNVHMRKRWQIVNGILECLGRFLSQDVSFKQLIQVLLSIPDEAFKWKFIHDEDQVETNFTHTFHLKIKINKILSAIPKDKFSEQFLQLSQQSFKNASKVQDLYRLIKINDDLPIMDIKNKISELCRSRYTKGHQMQILIEHMYWQSLILEQICWKIDQCFELLKLYILDNFNNQYSNKIVKIARKLSQNVLRGNNQNSRQQLAKFVEWLSYSICLKQSSQYLYTQYQLILEIVVLEGVIQQQELQIEDCLYGLLQNIESLVTPKQNRYSAIKLRLQVNLVLLLSKDPTFEHSKKEEFMCDPLSLIDRYDYEHYPEVIRFLKNMYLPLALSNKLYQELDKVQQALLESLLSNLQYSIVKEEVVSYVQFVLDCRILQQKQLWSQKYICKWMFSILKTGSNYIYFHRILTNTIYKHLTKNYKEIQQQFLVYYVDIVYELLQLEEYRGFDSQVAFYQEEKDLNLIDFRKQLPQKAQYFGMYPRFLFMKFIEERVKGNYSSSEQQFFISLGRKVFKFSIQDESANRMMFSPAFRSKLRLWQYMQMMVPFYNDEQNCSYLPELSCFLLKQLEQPNQPQIKHYTQIFATKIILNNQSYFTPIMIQRLKKQTSLSQSITNVIISGLLLKRNFNLQLYNSLLSFICHNTAYLRGLTQYFCFFRFELFESFILKNSLVRKLYQQFLINPDSKRLAERVNLLISQYQTKLQRFDVKYYCELQVYKAGEIVEEYIQDGLKKIGLQIVKEIKENDEGFILMRDLWKRQAQQILPKYQHSGSQSKGFQKKIDPIIEEFYLTQKAPSITHLRILASSINSIYNYGHLVRTGEIFSLQQLAIRSNNILSDDGFKSVSCTGEKWLRIREVCLDDMISYVLQCLSLGYRIVVIDESQNSTSLCEYKIKQKTLLVLPNEYKQFCQFIENLTVDKVFVGTGLSVHVQSALFMWQYVKQRVLGDQK